MQLRDTTGLPEAGRRIRGGDCVLLPGARSQAGELGGVNNSILPFWGPNSHVDPFQLSSQKGLKQLGGGMELGLQRKAHRLLTWEQVTNWVKGSRSCKVMRPRAQVAQLLRLTPLISLHDRPPSAHGKYLNQLFSLCSKRKPRGGGRVCEYFHRFR